MDITRITENNIEAFEELLPPDLDPGEDLLLFGAVTEEKEAVSCLIFRQSRFPYGFYGHRQHREK